MREERGRGEKTGRLYKSEGDEWGKKQCFIQKALTSFPGLFRQVFRVGDEFGCCAGQLTVATKE